MPQFIPGLELSRHFYHELVGPILNSEFPNLPHAAALIGYGSEVLGYDDETSTDHNWYPMVMLFLREEEVDRGQEIVKLLGNKLPYEFLGYPVNSEPDPDDPGTSYMKLTTEGPINHNVFCTTVRKFINFYLDYDIDTPLKVADWLTFPSQKLLEITAGGVHHDGFGELTAIRERLSYYPYDVWLYLLAAGWQRIDNLEGLMQRAGTVGDELGSTVIGSGLVRDIMSLCFLIEKQYAPYFKWFGSAFQRLKCASTLSPILRKVLVAQAWQDREEALCDAFRFIARLHNSLDITEALPEEPSNLEKRPYKAIHGGVFAEAILKKITDPDVKSVASLPLIGGIDQWCDNSDLRYHIYRRKTQCAFYYSNHLTHP